MSSPIKHAPLSNEWMNLVKILICSSLIYALLIALPAFAQETTPAPTNDPRAMFDISYSTVEEALSQSLTEKGVGDKVAALINGRNMKPIFSYTKPLTVDVRGLQYDLKSGHWEANLAFLDGSDVVSVLPASGHFDQTNEVAVLKREIRAGEIIHQSDVEIRDFPISRTRSDTITDFSGLIDKTPVRTISAFRPVRDSEVMNPPIVKKDAMVQMHYSLPGMDISATGQVMTQGAKGDVINVRNTASKKIIQAVVLDSENVNAIMTGADHAQN